MKEYERIAGRFVPFWRARLCGQVCAGTFVRAGLCGQVCAGRFVRARLCHFGAPAGFSLPEITRISPAPNKNPPSKACGKKIDFDSTSQRIENNQNRIKIMF